jgi:hypothetical protein
MRVCITTPCPTIGVLTAACAGSAVLPRCGSRRISQRASRTVRFRDAALARVSYPNGGLRTLCSEQVISGPLAGHQRTISRSSAGHLYVISGSSVRHQQVISRFSPLPVINGRIPSLSTPHPHHRRTFTSHIILTDAAAPLVMACWEAYYALIQTLLCSGDSSCAWGRGDIPALRIVARVADI